MKKLRYYSCLFILILLAIACRNDFTEIIETESESIDPTVFISTIFNGFVFDEAGDPLESVRITMDNNNAFTDSRGFFQISGKADSKGAYITAYLEGYYEAYGNIVPPEDASGHVRFTLKEKSVTSVISSNSEEKVNLDNGSEITFRANSFIDKNGSPYQGEVTVYADYIDPSASNFGSVMPGDLSAISIDEEAVILQSFGMLNVELESDSGEPLQINQEATIKVKVPDANLNIANDEIPLWYFDTSDGLWKEEGSAILINDYYVGEVTHFTLWNCDVPLPHVLLSGNIYSRGPIPFSTVKVTWVETGEMRITHTDEEGNFSGKVPSNALLLIEIIDDCGEVIYSQELGPLTEDHFVSIGLNSNEYDFFTVSGNLFCDGELVTNGYVLINTDNGDRAYSGVVDAQGHFSVEILNCDSESISVIGIDLDKNEQGEAIVVPIETEVTIEQIPACGNEIEFMAIFSYNNQVYTILDPVLDTIIVDANGTNYKIKTIDDFGTSQCVIEYSFAFWPNGNRYMGFALISYGGDNYRAKVQDEFSGDPESFELIETSEYVEFYVPNALILKTSPNGPIEKPGTFLVRARK